MPSTFNVSSVEYPEIEIYKESAMQKFSEFYEFKWTRNTPVILIAPDRNTIDLIFGRKTEEWLVGWSWGPHAVWILDPKKIKTESSHKEDYDIKKLIDHELAHAFFEVQYGFNSKLAWINEGMSFYLAEQLEGKRMPKVFSRFLNEPTSYIERGFAVKILIEKFGKEKLLEFLKKQSRIKTLEEQSVIFSEVFNAELSYETFNKWAGYNSNMNIDIHKAAGIIIKDKKLLVERSKNKEFFIAPGGSIEQGETPKQALVRELMEEFQITVKEEDLEEFGIFTAEAAGQPGRTVEMNCFVVKKWQGAPTPDNEVEQLLWIDSKIPTGIKVGSIFEHEVLPRLKQQELID